MVKSKYGDINILKQQLQCVGALCSRQQLYFFRHDVGVHVGRNYLLAAIRMRMSTASRQLRQL